MFALIPFVFAAPESSRPVLGSSLGAEAVTNDPFLVRDAVRLGATLRFARWIEVGVGAGWFPVLKAASYSTSAFGAYGEAGLDNALPPGDSPVSVEAALDLGYVTIEDVGVTSGIRVGLEARL